MGFELGSLGPQAGVLPIEPPLQFTDEFITDETTPIIQLLYDFRGSRIISESRLLVGGVVVGVGFFTSIT